MRRVGTERFFTIVRLGAKCPPIMSPFMTAVGIGFHFLSFSRRSSNRLQRLGP